MESGAISDKQMSASSQWDANHAAIQGRLHSQRSSGKAGSWSARTNDVSQWLEIDLGNQVTKVTRLATQGRNLYSQWVTKYKLQYSHDGVTFHYYSDQPYGAPKVTYPSSKRKTNPEIAVLAILERYTISQEGYISVFIFVFPVEILTTC